MMSSVTKHLRRNLIAYVALLFALSSTSYAAATKLLPANSVGTRQVINGSLLKADFKAGQLPRGPRGAAGDPGPAGIATVSAIDGPAVAMCAVGGGGCQVAGSTATCPTGSVVVGGGWKSDSVLLSVSFAERTGGTTYGVIAINDTGIAASITAQAICAVGPGVQSTAATTGASSASFEKALANAKNQAAR